MVDQEKEYDENGRLTGVKECRQAMYKVHTKRYASSAANFLLGDAVETGNGEAAATLLKEYETYGVTYDAAKRRWFYGGKRITVFFDVEKPLTYMDDAGSISLVLAQENGGVTLKQISAAEVQIFFKTDLPSAVTTEEMRR